MAGVPASGVGPGELKSNSVVCESSLGAARLIDRVFFPSNGDVTQTKRHPENQGRFNLGRKALAARTVRQASRGQRRAPT